MICMAELFFQIRCINLSDLNSSLHSVAKTQTEVGTVAGETVEEEDSSDPWKKLKDFAG